MLKYPKESFISGLILILVWIRFGQILTASVYYLDMAWWLGLWFFHWRRHTGRWMSTFGLFFVLPGSYAFWQIGICMSIIILGILQYRSHHDDIALENYDFQNCC